MHDIKIIRKNPDFFLKKLSERNVKFDKKSLLDLDKINRLNNPPYVKEAILNPNTMIALSPSSKTKEIKIFQYKLLSIARNTKKK